MDYQHCPNCEALNPPGVDRCQQCQAELPETTSDAAPPAPAAPESAQGPEPRQEDAAVAPFEALPDVLARVQQLEARIEERPGANALYLQLSQVYAEAGRTDLAAHALGRCLEHDPTNAYIRHRLSQLTGIPEPRSPVPIVRAVTPGVRPASGRPPTAVASAARQRARPRRARPRGRRPSRAVVLGAVLALVAGAVAAKLILFPGPRCLVTGPFSATGPVWSPTGTRLAFTMQEGERTQLGIYDLRRGEHRTVADLLGFGGSAYAWSSDGRQLAYVGAGDDSWDEAVYVVDLETDETRYVAAGRAPSWSSDGLSLLMWCAGSGPGYDDGMGDSGVWVEGGPCQVGVGDGVVSRGGRLPDDVSLGWETAVSPLLGRIAFERQGWAEGAPDIGGSTSPDGEFIAMVDSVAARGATNVAEASRDLSRELEARQYMERRRTGSEEASSGAESDIFVVSFLGGAPRQLTTDGHSRAPTWTAEGSKILYTRGRELWMMDADGGGQQALVRSPLAVVPGSRAALTPDGRHVLFVAPVEANEGMAQMMTGESPADLHVAEVGGSTARRLGNRHSFKQRFALSPNGKRIVYEVIADTGTLTDRRTRSELWMMAF